LIGLNPSWLPNKKHFEDEIKKKNDEIKIKKTFQPNFLSNLGLKLNYVKVDLI
jgi:hypothetical protein